MKKLLLVSTVVFGLTVAHSQDTIIVTDNYKFKIGGKFISEKSGDRAISPEMYPAYSGGIQIIDRIKKSNFSLESGLYYYNNVYENSYFIPDTAFPFGRYYTLPISYHNLSLPICLRYDTRLFYFSIGFYTDYLFSTSVLDGYSKQGNGFIRDASADRKINFGTISAIGLEKQFTKQFSFFVEARLLQNILSTKVDAAHHLFPNHSTFPNIVNYGFALGLNYKILCK
ncbi:MAG: hypothetical protein HY063_11705 [Bacteroidetes bacterium]|nr:hypothetical protein [Bacteroidota bacterium]